ncbi:hypothetical protein NG791_09530 [Laspinema sp. D1]|uniref:hypothetical protein n=1 Tax=Laspinema palackyanum TaxID=3231601 RepID=UPI003472A519|nr:hypothetical protein [Laspinema sp. D2b]
MFVVTPEGVIPSSFVVTTSVVSGVRSNDFSRFRMDNHSATVPVATTGKGLNSPERVGGDRAQRGITTKVVTTNTG